MPAFFSSHEKTEEICVSVSCIRYEQSLQLVKRLAHACNIILMRHFQLRKASHVPPSAPLIGLKRKYKHPDPLYTSVSYGSGYAAHVDVPNSDSSPGIFPGALLVDPDQQTNRV